MSSANPKILHDCAVRPCPVRIPRRMLMCVGHWRQVPKPLQDAVWATYKPGQERDGEQPSHDYRIAMHAAVQAVRSRTRAPAPTAGAPS